jgi:hypothetical protein
LHQNPQDIRTHTKFERGLGGSSLLNAEKTMIPVHIQKTTFGAVALTPTDFGFSFCATKEEMDSFQANLEAGMPMGQAVGFSGNGCRLSDIVRVQAKTGSSVMRVVAREFLGKAKEDFNFRTAGSREACMKALLQYLGPDWEIEQKKHSNIVLILVSVLGVVFGLFNVCCGGILLSAPPKPNPKPGETPPPPEVVWGFLIFGVLVAVACIAALFILPRIAGSTWETIKRR